MAKHKNISTKQLSSYLRKFTVGERSAIAKRSKEKIVSLKPKQRRKTSAFHVFRSEKWGVTARVGTEAWKAEQGRVVALWKRCNHKNYYVASAETQTKKRRRLEEQCGDEAAEIPSLSASQQWRATDRVCKLLQADHKKRCRNIPRGRGRSATTPRRSRLRSGEERFVGPHSWTKQRRGCQIVIILSH